jgi:hypothetical protein
MIWESMRHNWDDLDAMASASDVPRMISQLLTAATEHEARLVFDYIENNIVVQGRLFQSAPPTAACLVIVLPFSPPMARLVILELLNHLCGGNVSPEEEEAGYPLQQQCLVEVRKGLTSYLYLLQHGSNGERRECIDLLDMCAESDPSLTDQVVWHLEKAKEQRWDSDLDVLLENTLKHILHK